MRNSASEIAKLCESWWGRLTDTSKVEQRAYVMKLLALLDWDLPIPFSPQETAEHLNALTYLLRGDGQTTIAAYFLMPGALDAPSTVIEKGLDYCPTTRALMQESQSPNISYVLISDLYRTYFYDALTDELLLYADDPSVFNRDIANFLKRGQVARGALEEIRREPRSVTARHLRNWRKRWKCTFSEYNQVSESVLDALMDRLIVIRFLFQHDTLRRTRRRLLARFMDIAAEATTGGETARHNCGGKLVRLFHDMWLDWSADLFCPLAELDELLEENEQAAAMIKEFMLLAQSKFSIATILESFNYGDPTEKMRVRMVPDGNEERDAYLNRQELENIDEARIELDVHEAGYRALFHWFDKLIAVYDRLNLEFEAKTHHEIPERGDVDLFTWSAIDSKRPNACTDNIGQACAKGFGIYYTSDKELRISRLLFILHVIALGAQKQQTTEHLPAVTSIFMENVVPGTARNNNASSPRILVNG
ncbi:MAG: hypothetical protein KAH38_04620 [Candidatus Hydrogenedentes bacterium]|nr:hypothetical protein [Candidatus Hydrogenedentota bacterium]